MSAARRGNGNGEGWPLDDLFCGIDIVNRSGAPLEGRRITAITADSRRVTPGALFVALRGVTTDGHRFIGDALAAGAAAVVAELDSDSLGAVAGATVPVLSVADSQEVLGRIAGRFHGDPAERLTMIGITGTNGKTTVSYLMEHVLSEAGVRVGVIGTVDYRYHTGSGGVIRHPAPFTTPDPLHLHATLREMLDSGVTHVVMEVSSHALQQQRLGGIAYAVGVFTNLSQDHLDYHGSMHDYFEAKCLLFRHHLAPGAPVVLMESAPGSGEQAVWAGQVLELCRMLGLPVIRCGESEAANFRYLDSSLELSGMSVDFRDDGGLRRLLHSPLIGRFNVENLLVALAALVALGLETDRVCELLSEATGAPGRLERVVLPDRDGGQPTVLVDYAHTPDALDKVLQALRQVPHRTLYTVFGCGGDRDRTKRPLMGKIGAARSDVAIVTDDNPRSENPEAIRAEIRAGIEAAGGIFKPERWLTSRAAGERGCVEIGDRAAAIRAAVTTAGPEDIVLIAGKGHEQYQITAAGRRFFDDCLAARESGLLWDVDAIAAATGGRVVSRGRIGRFAAISTDTRKIRPGDVFVALRGETFDGHQFLEAAVDKGAACVVVSAAIQALPPGVACVEVGDTLRALGDLAGRRRQALKKLQQPVVVGITGSCGKTTVKEMSAAIFARRWPERADRPGGRVLKTAGNFNNLVGLPLSLLPASAKHRALILEMGMNRPGEIARLTAIADPDIACIVNIHGAHLEGLGSIEGVARAKGELFENSSERAVHIVNLDDGRVAACAAAHPRKMVRFAVTEAGRAARPEVWADEIGADKHGHLQLTLHIGDRQARLQIHAPGLHNGSNACCAAAIAWAASIDFDTIVAGLADFRSTANRMESLETPGGIRLLNDTYNANPASMASALQTLARLPARVRVAILGDMLELGTQSEALHEELGRRAAAAGLTCLGLIGSFSGSIRRGAEAGGMAPEQITVFTDKQRVVDWVVGLMHSGRVQAGDWVLVKASRGLALDTVVGDLLRTC